MLYEKNRKAELPEELFKNPTCEYRGAPFWAWNCRMTREEIDWILDTLKNMGMGGSHLHCRTGMDIPYLSTEFMDLVKYAHQKAEGLGMLTWLYDEDRFPSGAAGGKVTEDLAFRQRYLVFSPEPVMEGAHCSFLAKYGVVLEDGYLKEYRLLKKEEEPEGFEIWYLYREIAGDNAWFNNEAYLDVLNPRAVDRFIEITHEAYYCALGEHFGETVPAIFTDEPQFSQKSMLGFAKERERVTLPWTDDFRSTYEEAYGCDFFETFPECIWELPKDQLSVARYRYHDHICERFAESFADRIGRWCSAHGIALTGHMMQEPTLASQTGAIGEAMRSYRAFTIPGIDMLYDARELNTAKQAQSAVHQYGREGMMSELYGVTGWEFDFRGHKLAGDWQAALGVTVRVPHLTWTSMAGEAKRDYPASIGYQSPWYGEYTLLEDYFARLNTALTRGKPVVKVGVLHPIESYWLYWGTREHTQGLREEMDQRFRELTEWLLFGLIDFDFISEALWRDLTPNTELSGEKDFQIGEMQYDTILVPNCVTLRESTLKRLMAFQRGGGRVLFVGKIPTLVDAVSSEAALVFAESCEKIEFSRNGVLDALKEERLVDIRSQYGVRTDNMLYQLRSDGKQSWLFLAHCNPMKNPDLPREERLVIEIKGTYQPILYDAMTGAIRESSYIHKGGSTFISETVYDHDSLLYALVPTEQKQTTAKIRALKRKYEPVLLLDEAEVTLEEPNVLILDMAEARLDDGPWERREEILRLDNRFRERVGYPKRGEAFVQPWIMTEEERVEHRVTLRYVIHSEILVTAPILALEHAREARVTVNGEEVFRKKEWESSPCHRSYFVDHSIETVRLPDLQAGENILMVELPYYHKLNLESMYLLGDFGVRTAGKWAVLISPVRKLAFGDICGQGFPFYGGNLTYRIPLNMEKGGNLRIEATQFRCPLIKVTLDKKDCGRIAFSPYTAEIEGVAAGSHLLELTAFGNRHNTFGALHNCNQTVAWKGHPDSYRTVGSEWAYEYQLHPQGILKSPRVSIWNDINT